MPNIKPYKGLVDGIAYFIRSFTVTRRLRQGIKKWLRIGIGRREGYYWGYNALFRI